MIVTIALAAALSANPGDIYTDDAGCRWRKPATTTVVKRKLKPPAPAASAAPPIVPIFKTKSRPKRSLVAKPKSPEDEFIGCDDAPPPERSFTPVPPAYPDTPWPWMYTTPFAPLEPEAPPTFEQRCDCAAGFPPTYGPPVFVGVPVPQPIPFGPAVPIPEPRTTYLLLVGFAALVVVARVRSRGERRA